VDFVGNGFVGLAAPTNTSVPAISGLPEQGQTLSEQHGTWAGVVGSYAYQWQQCDSQGNGCAGIPGAIGQTYTPKATDVGHTIRVQEIASNSGGSGAPATSAATAVVQSSGSGGGGGGSGGGTGGSPTAKAKVTKVVVHGTKVLVSLSCTGNAKAKCPVNLKLTVTETLRRSKVIAVTAALRRPKTRKKVVVVGTASAILTGGQRKTVTISLNRAGRHLLLHRRTLKVTLTVTQGRTRIYRHKETLHKPKPKRRHHRAADVAEPWLG
jgi:hypothetical protein